MHRNRMKVDAEGKCFFEQYKPEELEAVITRQHKIAEYHKKNRTQTIAFNTNQVR